MRCTGKKNQQTGFTIVELLIVIVVIGILAAITIVAYNGIQARAGNAQTIAAVKEYYKGYTAYAIDNGSYPLASNYCHGQGYPSNYCWDNRTYTENTVANDALKKYMGSLPNPSTANVYRNATDGNRRGILFVTGSHLRYQLQGTDTQCGLSGATRSFTTGESTGPECNLPLPNPATL